MASNTSSGIAKAGDAVEIVRLNLRLPPSLVVGLATAIVVIVLVGVLSWAALQDQFQTRQDTIAALDVDAAVNTVLSGVKDAETGQRGFLITRREDYLQPYLAARTRLRADLERLLVLVDDDPEQLQRARGLRELILVRLDLLQQVVDLQREASMDDAVALVSSGRGKQLMDEVRGIAQAMLDHEQGVLVARKLD